MRAASLRCSVFARGRGGEAADVGELRYVVFLGDIGRLPDDRRGRDLVRRGKRRETA